MDKRTIQLASEWYIDAGIQIKIEGLKIYAMVDGFLLELSESEILYRAECQIHLMD